jgi:Ni/Fe-hydrogenase subunit HybB-like protein
MDMHNLLFISISAFIAVFFVLSVIAIFMRIILLVFPESKSDNDTAIFAAIGATVSTLFPGSKITKIEEEK